MTRFTDGKNIFFSGRNIQRVAIENQKSTKTKDSLGHTPRPTCYQMMPLVGMLILFFILYWTFSLYYIGHNVNGGITTIIFPSQNYMCNCNAYQKRLCWGFFENLPKLNNKYLILMQTDAVIH